MFLLAARSDPLFPQAGAWSRSEQNRLRFTAGLCFDNSCSGTADIRLLEPQRSEKESDTADAGSNFRTDSCQYVYNLSASALGIGTYRVEIKIGGIVVGSTSFGLK